MSQAVLYINSKGRPITTHSHSAGESFNSCHQLYKLGRKDGWTRKDKNAAMKFGSCVEDSMREYHRQDDGLDSALVDFTRRWTEFKDVTELIYTKTEENWENMLAMGLDIIRLYAAKLPFLPIVDPRFQLNFKKEVFPRSHLAGINFTSYVDMISTPEDPKKPLLIDIKVMGYELNDTPGIVKLDPQLRKYSWATGIRHVGFLWFVKQRMAIKKGDQVSLLTLLPNVVRGDLPQWKPLDTVLVNHYDKEINQVTVLHPDGTEVIMSAKAVTKVRLQFATATLSDEDAKEAGEEIGKEIAEIHMANERNSWPKQPGIRFPNNKCLMCPMLGICVGDDALRDKLVEREFTSDDWLGEEAA